jgi:hypothetical protein
MHALNAHAGRPAYDEASFGRLVQEYDAHMKIGTSAADYDAIGSDQMSLVAWALYRQRIALRYYAIGTTQPTTAELATARHGELFIYTRDHIWFARRDATTPTSWWVLDSMAGGPRLVRDADLLQTSPGCATTGTMLVVDPYEEWERNCALISTLVKGAHSHAAVRAWCSQMHASKSILGDVEIPMRRAMVLLEMFDRPTRGVGLFHPITSLIKIHRSFNRRFVRGRYTDIDLIRMYVPYIIPQLMALRTRLAAPLHAGDAQF